MDKVIEQKIRRRASYKHYQHLLKTMQESDTNTTEKLLKIFGARFAEIDKVRTCIEDKNYGRAMQHIYRGQDGRREFGTETRANEAYNSLLLALHDAGIV